jgi:hypothetical protein
VKQTLPYNVQILFLVFATAFVVQSGCEKPAVTNTGMSKVMLNQQILDEANAAAKWFHAKKNRPIWAKRLELAQTVKTLEGEEQVEAGHYLCRGEAGDIWPQTEKDLTRRYQVTNEIDADGWRKYRPNPDAEGVMATQIDHSFSVHASWGTLSGKSGDYLLKNWHDRDIAYPQDVWIVDQTLFQQTYEVVTEDNDG